MHDDYVRNLGDINDNESNDNMDNSIINYYDHSRPIDPCDFVSTDDIISMPLEDAEEMLNQLGIDKMPPMDDVKRVLFEKQKNNQKVHIHYPKCSGSSLVPQGFATNVSMALLMQENIVICGGNDSGKTYFVRNILRECQLFNSLFKRTTYVNCKSLGTQNISRLQKDMISSQFGLNEKEFHEFYRDVEGEDKKLLYVILEKYFRKRYQGKKGIMILDHMEYLSNEMSVVKYISKVLVPCASNNDVTLVFCQKSVPDNKERKIYRTSSIMEFPKYTCTDVDNWIKTIEKELGVKFVINSSDIRECIGLRPGVLMNFRSYLKSMIMKRKIVRVDRFCLNSYMNAIIRFGHHPDCEKFIRIIREYPETYISLIKTKGVFTNMIISAMDNKCLRRLVSTGVISLDKDDPSFYTSELYERRAKKLLSPEGMAIGLALNGKTEIHKSWKYIKAYREYSTDLVTKNITSSNSPSESISMLEKIFERWNIRVETYIRDFDNYKLWAPAHKLDAFGPLKPVLQPDFTKAIQQGDTVRCEDGRWFIPVIGNSGTIIMVFRVEVKDAIDEWYEMAQISALKCFVGNIKYTLTHIVQRLVSKHERDIMEKIALSLREENICYRRILEIYGAVGWTILKVSEESQEWLPVRTNNTEGSEYSVEKVKYAFGEISQDNVISINKYKKNHGCVLSEEKMKNIFPKTQNGIETVYMQPVGSEHAVVFLFNKRIKNVLLNGMTQKYMELMAPQIVLEHNSDKAA